MHVSLPLLDSMSLDASESEPGTTPLWILWTTRVGMVLLIGLLLAKPIGNHLVCRTLCLRQRRWQQTKRPLSPIPE